MMISEKTYLKLIGTKISSLRKVKNLSQLDVCAEIEMEKSYLSSIENGHQNVTILTLKKIADAMEVNMMEFFDIKS